MITVKNEYFPVGKPYASIITKIDGEGFLSSRGHYYHPIGIIEVSQVSFLKSGYRKPGKSSKFRFQSTFMIIINGGTHYRTIRGKKYTNIGLARKAGEFARHLQKHFSFIKNSDPKVGDRIYFKSLKKYNP